MSTTLEHIKYTRVCYGCPELAE